MADVMDSLLKIGVGVTSVVAASAAAYFMTSYPEPLHPGFDINNQTLILEDGSRMSALMASQNDGKPTETIFDDVRTVYDCFERGLRVSQHGHCLGTRSGPKKEYEWLTYQQVSDRSGAFGSGLIQLGLTACQDSFVGIYSKNRTEWVIAERGAAMYSMVTIPLYDILGEESCQHIVNLANITLVVCDNEVRLKKLIDNASRMPCLKTIVAMDTVSKGLKEEAVACSIRIVSFNHVEELGANNPAKHVPPKPSDLVTISFTSGTTGTPKGAMLTHANMVANIGAFMHQLKHCFDFAPHNIHLSYLPLPHMFERIVQALVFINGCSIGFYSGDVALLFEDMQMLKPTIFCTVPRLINKIRDKVYGSTAGSKLKSFMLNLAVSQKSAYVRRGIITKTTLWDKLVFQKVQNLLGGKVDFIIIGSAPLSAETMDFFKCATGCMIVSVYGQTECTAAASAKVPGDITGEHVGNPIACNYIKLVDVPELGYYSADNQGEICFKGTSVFRGYFKEPELTAEAIDKDGWLHSGDIGRWLSNGALKVIDRKKHIFKLSQGEYIAPERIEQIYLSSTLVAQVFIEGDSKQNYIMGVVVPDPEPMMQWATQNGVSTDMETLCSSKEAKEAVISDLHEEGRKAGLKGFEQVKDILLWPEPFSIDNGLMTPTFKTKRPQLRQKFKSHIENLYKINA